MLRRRVDGNVINRKGRLDPHAAKQEHAARRLNRTNTFHNSILCTNESVVVAEESIADKLHQAMSKVGAYVSNPEFLAEAERLKVEINPRTGEWVEDFLRKSQESLTAEVRNRAQRILGIQ
jgi:acyl-CoA reductase-like NAD-dependent aldehyde dehydrogenase